MGIRWGIAGCGWVARDYVAPAIVASGNGSLAALYDVSAASLSRAAGLFPMARAYADQDAFFGAIDAVYIASPNDAHCALVEAAAAAAVPVLCEKPMATSMADAQAMVDACARAGVAYATAFDQRFHPAHQHLAGLVRDGALGNVTAIRIAYCCWVGADFQGDNWRIDPARAGGGALIDLAPHGLDLASFLLGDRLVDIAAMGQSKVHAYAVEDGAVLIAQAAGGALVQLHVAYNCPETYPRRRLEVLGTTAQIVATDTLGQTPGGTLELTHAATGATELLVVPGAERSPFLNQVEAFAAALLAGQDFAFPPLHDLHIMDLVLRAQRQARPELTDAA
ncbi:Gfo/Idh/MocA family protein [Acidisphaera sp. L21]|uniref:Gfo/Idh/MocA family protein n=1 Tax=Acidisphaera sp. L21 TaxID=1641851 RepID=UPI001C207525|nr:Gfo/Idh/MocA family oxidoreductase [Acidisphaera sp. L21]